MNRRGFLTGAIATPLIIPAAKLEWTNTIIRRPKVVDRVIPFQLEIHIPDPISLDVYTTQIEQKKTYTAHLLNVNTGEETVETGYADSKRAKELLSFINKITCKYG